ncbi:MAG TPA: DUF2867 domain-containing protein [Acidimicrobiales bacterium]
MPEAVRAADTMAAPDYVDGFSLLVPASGEVRTPEDWARAVFDDAPAALYQFVVIGWRVFLGLRLGPRPSPDCVIGWRLADRGEHWVRMEVGSAMLEAHIVFWLDQERLTFSTSVHYTRRRARLLWSALAPVHHQVVPMLLRSAARRAGGSSAAGNQ